MGTLGTCDCSCIKLNYLPPYRTTVYFPFYGHHPYLGDNSGAPNPPILYWTPTAGPVCLTGPYGGSVTDHYLVREAIHSQKCTYDWTGAGGPVYHYGYTDKYTYTRHKFSPDEEPVQEYTEELDGSDFPDDELGTPTSESIVWITCTDTEWHSTLTWVWDMTGTMGLIVTQVFENHHTLTSPYTWAEYTGLIDALLAVVTITNLTAEAAKIAACDEWTYSYDIPSEQPGLDWFHSNGDPWLPGDDPNDAFVMVGPEYLRPQHIHYKVAGVEIDHGYNQHFLTYDSGGNILHVNGIEYALATTGPLFWWPTYPGAGAKGARVYVENQLEILGYGCIGLYPVGAAWASIYVLNPEELIIRGNTDYILTSWLEFALCNPQSNIDTPIHTAASGWLSFEPIQEELLSISIAP